MKIVLAGDGWGAVALYNSFVKVKILEYSLKTLNC